MGFWDGSTQGTGAGGRVRRALRVHLWGFCGAFLSFGVRGISVYLESDVLAWLSVIGMLGSIGVMFFAVLLLPFLSKH